MTKYPVLMRRELVAMRECFVYMKLANGATAAELEEAVYPYDDACRAVDGLIYAMREAADICGAGPAYDVLCAAMIRAGVTP